MGDVTPALDGQSTIDQQNKAFWNELCGTQLAKRLGVTDWSQASLAKFDTWYLEFYDYLYRYIPLTEMRGKRTLEVGLGYGTVAQKIAEAGAVYSGLDIADGPVKMTNHRLQQIGVPEGAVVGSALQNPFADNTFDYVVAIGCFHHTGNLQLAIDETWRVLKPGGRAVIMVYYAYSYRRWLLSPMATTRHFLTDKFAIGTATKASAAERARYDASTVDGIAAPETAFASGADIKRLATRWTRCTVSRNNIGIRVPSPALRRLANATLGPLMGLDIYCTLQR
jgi:SAM-dependent methyltransferase